MTPIRRHNGFKPSAWQRELKRVLRDPGRLAKALKIDPAATQDLVKASSLRPLAISPRMLEKMRKEDVSGPLHQQLLPSVDEVELGPGESHDPLAELTHQAAPGLIHRYPDRALLLLTGECASYCRFCTRARMAGVGGLKWEPALEYVRHHPEIREVILSGGDPLMLPDRDLDLVLRELRSIAHVEIVRFGTRMPVFLPKRITGPLVRILSRAKPLFVLIHVNHLSEMGKDFNHAIARLVDAGLPVLSQTVLLRGVNDDVETLANLFRGLLRQRVMPYYLHSVDLATGTSALRVDIERGMQLVGALRDQMSGLAVPDYVADLPDAGGKILLAPDRLVATQEDGHFLRAVDGRSIWLPRPRPRTHEPK